MPKVTLQASSTTGSKTHFSPANLYLPFIDKGKPGGRVEGLKGRGLQPPALLLAFKPRLPPLTWVWDPCCIRSSRKKNLSVI